MAIRSKNTGLHDVLVNPILFEKRRKAPRHLKPHLMGCLCRTVDFDVDFDSFCVPHEDIADLVFDAIPPNYSYSVPPLNKERFSVY